MSLIYSTFFAGVPYRIAAVRSSSTGILLYEEPGEE